MGATFRLAMDAMREAADSENPIWREISELKPRLRSHVACQRHEARGRLWYALGDATSNRHFRLSEGAYLAAGLMDGQRTMAEIRDILSSRLGPDVTLKSGDLIRLLAQLHNADAIRHEGRPDLAELWHRGEAADRQSFLMRIRSPLAIRIGLFDPDEFLERTSAVGRFVFSRFGLFLWLLLIGYTVLQIGAYWDALTLNLTDRVLAAENLILAAFVFPILKALHELGHGYAVKRLRGECHEIGIMFLVFMPVPYVDASSASLFSRKFDRVLVGAAGMYVELAVAAVAFLLWREMEPGLVRSALFNVMLIGGVSTVFFNGNPLLRFDGYFVLTDLVSIPNLGPRSNRYISYLAKKYIAMVGHLQSPVLAEGERFWFVSYGIASFFYRMLIVVTIIFFVSQKFFFIGVLLALWLAYTVFLKPVVKIVSWLLWSPELQSGRRAALAIVGCLVLLGGYLLFVMPAPRATVATGVLWADEETELSFEIDGEVARVDVLDEGFICSGCPVASVSDPELGARLKALEARLGSLEATRRAELATGDFVAAEISDIEIAHVRERIDQAHMRQQASRLVSPVSGQVFLFERERLVGRFVRRGELIGYVFPGDVHIVRAVVRQDEIGLVREGVEDVAVVMSDSEWQVLGAEVQRISPSSTAQLPSMALATVAGGPVSLDPASPPDEPVAMEEHYEIVVRMNSRVENSRFGQRAHVRLAHAPEPLGFQAMRGIRQIFLRRFNV